MLLSDKFVVFPLIYEQDCRKSKISTFGTFAEKHFSATFRKCLLINVQDCSSDRDNKCMVKR